MNWSHPVMYYLSLLFLALVATLIVLWIDVPRVFDIEDFELVSGATDDALSSQKIADYVALYAEREAAIEFTALQWGRWIELTLFVLWPLFIAEQIVLLFLTKAENSKHLRNPYWLWMCLVPPLRLCARKRGQIDEMWFPWDGWRKVDHQLQRELEREFSVPMIIVALMILPIMGVQLYFKERIIEYPVLRYLAHFGTGLIWFAFASEFIVMVSVTNKKIQYCKKHWLDLLIILLPLVSFLRSIQMLRAGRFAKLGKLQQLSKIVRVYRLRGVSMRALRALLLLEVFHRLLRTTPEKRIAKLQEEYVEKERELKLLAAEIERLQQQHRAGVSKNNSN